jgi:hypothetical protein
MSKRAVAQALAIPIRYLIQKWDSICGLTGEMFSLGLNGKSSTPKQ